MPRFRIGRFTLVALSHQAMVGFIGREELCGFCGGGWGGVARNLRLTKGISHDHQTFD